MKKNYTSFRCQEGSWIQIRKILSDATLIILERMHLAIILLLVKSRFQNHWSNGKHNAKISPKTFIIDFQLGTKYASVMGDIWK